MYFIAFIVYYVSFWWAVQVKNKHDKKTGKDYLRIKESVLQMFTSGWRKYNGDPAEIFLFSAVGAKKNTSSYGR